MKNIFKRAVAMLLFAVMILTILPPELGTVFAASDVTSSETTYNLLTEADHNYNFQNSLWYNASKPKNWTEFASRSWASHELVKEASGDSALKHKIVSGGENATGTNAVNALYSEAINVESYVGKNLVVNMDAKIVSGTPGLQVFVFFYTNTSKPTAIASSGVEGSGSFNLGSLVTNEWTTVSSSQLPKNQTVLVPDGAKYARIFLYFKSTNIGEICIDNVVLTSNENTQLTDSFEAGGVRSGLPLGWTYATSASANTAENKYFEVVDLTSTTTPSALNGTHALKFTQAVADGIARGVFSPYIDVSSMESVSASVDLFGASTLQIYIMFYDENYNCPTDSEWRPWKIDDSPNGWNQVNFEVAVPTGAKYARLCLYKSTTAYYDGTTYIDRIALKETAAVDSSQVCPDVPEFVEYDWEIVETSHPRVYFNSDELDQIKAFTKSSTLNAMGYSGTKA